MLFLIGLGRYVSPLFGVAIGGDVKYGLGWGLPFINRVQNFTVGGVAYDELPDLLLVGTQSYIAPMFWKVRAALYLPRSATTIIPYFMPPFLVNALKLAFLFNIAQL